MDSMIHIHGDLALLQPRERECLKLEPCTNQPCESHEKAVLCLRRDYVLLCTGLKKAEVSLVPALLESKVFACSD